MNQSNKPYIQFSKRLTVAVTAIWGVLRLLALIFIAFHPETSESLTEFQKGVDDVMMVAIGFYCGNSVAEKGITGYSQIRQRNQTGSHEEEASG